MRALKLMPGDLDSNEMHQGFIQDILIVPHWKAGKFLGI